MSRDGAEKAWTLPQCLSCVPRGLGAAIERLLSSGHPAVLGELLPPAAPWLHWLCPLHVQGVK